VVSGVSGEGRGEVVSVSGGAREDLVSGEQCEGNSEDQKLNTEATEEEHRVRGEEKAAKSPPS
jgi:hypothetical protein